MSPSRIRVESDRGICVIRFLDSRLYDDRTVRDVSDQLLQVLAELPPGESMILDFTGVQIASSAMLARLILLLRRIESLGGRLRLCELGEGIAQTLRTTNLDSIFAIDRDRREALEHATRAR